MPIDFSTAKKIDGIDLTTARRIDLERGETVVRSPEIGPDGLPGPGEILTPPIESAAPQQGLSPQQAAGKSARRVGSLVGGAAAGTTKLLGIPLQAAGGIQQAFTGERPEYADVATRLAEEQKRVLAGEALNTPEGRILAEGGEFLGFGWPLRTTAKALNKGAAELAQRAPALTDIMGGAAFQGAAEAGGGIESQLAASFGAMLLMGKAPKSDQLNAVERQVADAIRNVNGSIENAVRNGRLNEAAKVDTTLAAMTENPTLSASVKALSAKSQIAAQYFENTRRRFIETINNTKDVVRVNEAQADAALNNARESYQKIIDDGVKMHNDLVKSGASTPEVSQALHQHLANLESTAKVAASEAYDSINLAALPPVKPGKIVTAMQDAIKTGTVKESDGIILNPEVRQLAALIKNEMGGKVIQPKVKELPNGKTVTIRRGRVVEGNDSLSVEALVDIRSKAMDDIRSIRAANGGETDMTRRLGKVVDAISTELEKYPELAKANEGWKAFKGSFHDGQIAAFFAKRGSGTEKVAPERMFNVFIKGSEKNANAEQVKRIFERYDTDGKMRSAFITDLQNAFDSSLALKMEGKSGLSGSEWNAWIRQNRDAIKAFDKELGTDLMKRYGRFRNAAAAVDEAEVSLSQLEGLSFSQKMGGSLDKVVKSNLANGTLNKLAESMPNDFLKNAVVRRAASDLTDLEKNIASPDKLWAQVQSNKATLVQELGVENFKRIEGVVNAIKKEAAVYSGAPIEAVRMQLLSDGETVRRTINLATAVIGSVRRRGFKIAQVMDDAAKGRLMIEAFTAAMTDPKAQRRILEAASKEPKTIKNMWLLSTVAPVQEAMTGE